MWKESPEASTPSARSLLRRWKAGEGGGHGYFLRVCSGVTRLDATPTVIVGSVMQLDGSRAVLQHPVGFFLSAGLQCDALALAADASLDLFSQSQRRHKSAERREKQREWGSLSPRLSTEHVWKKFMRPNVTT